MNDMPSVSSVLPSLGELLNEFSELDDPQEQFEYLIDLGKRLKPLPAELCTSDNLVKGCQSIVWLVTEWTDQVGMRRVRLLADSDALMVKGLIVVLLAIFDGLTPNEILMRNESSVLEQLGLTKHLSPQRRNGLFAMVKRIKQKAMEQLHPTRT